MNIALWVLQVLLALHTLMGAVWKFSNSEQSVGSLKAIPHALWLGLSGIEILAVVGLLIPVVLKKLGVLAPAAAIVIALEMLAFCAVHLASGEKANGQVVYWLVVAALSGFIAFGRLSLQPLS